MSSDKSNQLLIREAIRKIALGRSMERINLAPGGMSGIGTARMIHGYVAKIHDNPSDEEFSDYGGTIDVGEYPDETASAEPVIHKGVLLSAATNYEGENETYIEASVENSSSILYDKEIRNKPRTRRTKRNV